MVQYDPKMVKNGSKMVQKWSKNDQNDPNIIQQRTKNDFKMVQNVPRWSKNCPQVVQSG